VHEFVATNVWILVLDILYKLDMSNGDMVWVRVSKELKERLVSTHGKNLSGFIRKYLEESVVGTVVAVTDPDGVMLGSNAKSHLPTEKELVELAVPPRERKPKKDVHDLLAGVPKGNPNGTAEERSQAKNYEWMRAKMGVRG